LALGMTKRAALLLATPLAIVVVVAAYASTLVISYERLLRPHDSLLVADVARLLPTRVQRIDRVHRVEELQAILAEANTHGWKVSIAGSKHSQGGHTYYPGAVVLDMKSFNQVVALDREHRTITVESGATWDEIQRYINPYGLAVKVMQSSYVFTVGGTMSANAHGRDLDKTSFVETVRSFHLLLADGKIVNVSRTENPELFRLVIGGYGMFGVILDATLQLTDDVVFERRATVIDYHEFPEYFATHIHPDSTVGLMLVRPSISPATFLREMVVTTWHVTSATPPAGIHTLGEERHVLRDRFFFGLSRRFDWGKRLRWSLQRRIESTPGRTKLISRNNAMRPPETPLEFLDYYSARNTDIIQEYYVPVRNFTPFLDEFRRILTDGHMNVISSTIRYVKANDETALAYAPREDAFAIIQMSNVGLSAEEQRHAQAVTQQLVDAAIRFGGTYYLTYQPYATREQLRKAYPKADDVFDRKRFYDPGERFMNTFYARYGQRLDSSTAHATPK
jgi:decaprenylphospho-beta-D-ribofuranose 2-oxidase